MNRRHWQSVLILAAVASCSVLPLGPALGQEASPLQKSDVIRLLAGGTYTQAEIVAIIRRSCLSFHPTERDLSTFRALGAEVAVMSAVGACVRGGRVVRPVPSSDTATAVAAPAKPSGPARSLESRTTPPELTLFLSPRRVTVSPGERVTVTAEVTSGSLAAANLTLQLRAGDSGSSGPVVASASTDGEGRATFELAADSVPGIRRFSVVAVGRSIYGANVLEMRTADETEGRATRGGRESGRVSAAAAGAERDSIPSRGGAGAEEETPGNEISVSLERARDLSISGRYGSANAMFSTLLERSPNDVDVLLEYGHHLERVGDGERAREMLERARMLEPARIDVRKALGSVNLLLGRPDEAVQWFRSATDLAPKDAEAWMGLGRALAAAGQADEARKAFRKARELGT
ncbi:MAG: tetratricopeptide repeat protein [Gemmatimonadota bacterium]